MNPRRAIALETVWVEVPEEVLETYEAALATVCGTVGFFVDDATGRWRVEGIKPRGEGEAQLAAALALADAASGVHTVLQRVQTEAEGWLARTYAAFPEQRIGRRFAVRGSHLPPYRAAGRITIVLDAGLAFGSGEHGSTRGCLRALEQVAPFRPRRVLDLGTGSGILAIAAAKLLHRPVIATDIEPWSVRVTRANARRNGVGSLVRSYRADGWRQRPLTSPATFDLVFANILARPLSRMAPSLSAHLRPGGHAILAGLLFTHVPMVLAAHRGAGLQLVARYEERPWTTLLLRKPDRISAGRTRTGCPAAPSQYRRARGRSGYTARASPLASPATPSTRRALAARRGQAGKAAPGGALQPRCWQLSGLSRCRCAENEFPAS